MVKSRGDAWALLGLPCCSKNKSAQNIKFNSGIPYATFHMCRCNFAMLLRKRKYKKKKFFTHIYASLHFNWFPMMHST